MFQLDHTSGPNECSIEIMNPDGSGAVDLTGTRRGCETYPSFTPDGRHIVFARDCASCHSAVWSMNLHGGARHLIHQAPPSLGAVDPNVSPDGSTIAFVGEHSESRKALYTITMNGTDLTRLVPLRFGLGTHIDWAPDGSRILFTENQAGTSNAATIQPDGTGMVFLTHYRDVMGAGGSSYSPDGRWIVFRLQNNNTGKYWLAEMRSNGAHRTRVRSMQFLFGSSDWGPRPG